VINCWFDFSVHLACFALHSCTITQIETRIRPSTFKKMRRSASAESMTSPASDADFRLRRMANARSVGGMSNASNADEREALRGELRNVTAEREAMAKERAAIAAERAAMVADMQRIVEEAIRADRCAFSCELQTRLDSTTASLLATASSQASTIAKAEVQAATALVSSHVMAQTGQTREPRGRNLRSAEFEAAKAELSQHASRATEATTQATAAAALAEQAVVKATIEAREATALAEQAAAKVVTLLEELRQRQSVEGKIALTTARAQLLPSTPLVSLHAPLSVMSGTMSGTSLSPPRRPRFSYSRDGVQLSQFFSEEDERKILGLVDKRLTELARAVAAAEAAPDDEVHDEGGEDDGDGEDGGSYDQIYEPPNWLLQADQMMSEQLGVTTPDLSAKVKAKGPKLTSSLIRSRGPSRPCRGAGGSGGSIGSSEWGFERGLDKGFEATEKDADDAATVQARAGAAEATVPPTAITMAPVAGAQPAPPSASPPRVVLRSPDWSRCIAFEPDVESQLEEELPQPPPSAAAAAQAAASAAAAAAAAAAQQTPPEMLVALAATAAESAAAAAAAGERAAAAEQHTSPDHITKRPQHSQRNTMRGGDMSPWSAWVGSSCAEALVEVLQEDLEAERRSRESLERDLGRQRVLLLETARAARTGSAALESEVARQRELLAEMRELLEGALAPAARDSAGCSRQRQLLEVQALAPGAAYAALAPGGGRGEGEGMGEGKPAAERPTPGGYQSPTVPESPPGNGIFPRLDSPGYLSYEQFDAAIGGYIGFFAKNLLARTRPPPMPPPDFGGVPEGVHLSTPSRPRASPRARPPVSRGLFSLHAVLDG
jgi:hypothetical protein